MALTILLSVALAALIVIVQWNLHRWRQVLRKERNP